MQSLVRALPSQPRIDETTSNLTGIEERCRPALRRSSGLRECTRGRVRPGRPAAGNRRFVEDSAMRSRSRSLRGRSGFDPATGPACRSASRRSNPAPEPFAKRLVRTWHCDYAARTSQSHFSRPSQGSAPRMKSTFRRSASNSSSRPTWGVGQCSSPRRAADRQTRLQSRAGCTDARPTRKPW